MGCLIAGATAVEVRSLANKPLVVGRIRLDVLLPVEVERGHVVRNLAVGVALGREGSRKVCAREPCDVRPGVRAVDGNAVGRRVAGKPIGHRGTRTQVLPALRGIPQVELRTREVAVRELVRIALEFHDISARVELVAAKAVAVLVVGVVARHVVQRKGQLDLLALARLEELRLRVGNEDSRGLLDAALGVWGCAVQLHDIAAGAVARIGHANGRRVHGVAGDAEPLTRRAGRDLPAKARIRKPVAEGVLHHAVVALAEAIAHAAPVPFRVCRLVPAIPDVDTLDVVHKAQRIVLLVRADVGVLRAVGGIKPAAVRVEALSHGTGVSPARRRREVVGKGIGRAAGGVHLALERGDYRIRPDLARRPGKKRRVDPGDGLELAEFHRVRRVDHDDGVLVVGTGITKKRDLLARELEVTARGVHRHVAAAGANLVLLAGAVDALAGSPPNDDDRRVRVLLGIGKKVVGIAVLVVDARLV